MGKETKAVESAGGTLMTGETDAWETLGLHTFLLRQSSGILYFAAITNGITFCHVPPGKQKLADFSHFYNT